MGTNEEKMKAVLYDKSVSPFPLALRAVQKPVPSAGEVLVKIFAVSINAADYRSLRMGIIPKNKIFGADIAGRIVAAGTGVIRFKVGDEVFGDIASCGFGGFAEYVAVPEGALATKLSDVTFENAAALPMAAVTALQGLRNVGKIQAGQRVLIYGASGGVGTFAIQLAKNFGAEVTAVCSAKNTQLARSLGADHPVDYTKEDFAKAGDRYDLILAVNGNRPLTTYQHVLKPGGTFVMAGGKLTQVIGSILFGPLLSLGGKKMKFLAARPNTDDLEYIIKHVKEGKIKPVIDRRFPFDQTIEAMQYCSEGHARGKVVITITK